MPDFQLDRRLQTDCHLLAATSRCSYLLHRNAAVDWLILVPHTRVTEFYLLPAKLQRDLCVEINRVSGFIQTRLGADKINVATLGNVVTQLHIHVIGRRHDDAYWPDPVWGKPSVVAPRDDRQVEAIRRQWLEYPASADA